MSRLIDLEPVFLKYTVREIDQTSFADTTAHPGKRTLEEFRHVENLADASGIRFTCPKCGDHQVLVWFRDSGVPDHVPPKPGRWHQYGTGFNDLSLTPSIALGSACGWHGFITNGEVT